MDLSELQALRIQELAELAKSLKISDDISAELIWKPKNLIKVDNETAEKVLKIFETLEESDDVQTVSSNFDISDETLNKLRA